MTNRTESRREGRMRCVGRTRSRWMYLNSDGALARQPSQIRHSNLVPLTRDMAPRVQEIARSESGNRDQKDAARRPTLTQSRQTRLRAHHSLVLERWCRTRQTRQRTNEQNARSQCMYL